MKKALVCGAGGFIASHLVKRLKQEPFWVRGVDLKRPEFSPTAADDFQLLDLREEDACDRALSLESGGSRCISLKQKGEDRWQRSCFRKRFVAEVFSVSEPMPEVRQPQAAERHCPLP